MRTPGLGHGKFSNPVTSEIFFHRSFTLSLAFSDRVGPSHYKELFVSRAECGIHILKAGINMSFCILLLFLLSFHQRIGFFSSTLRILIKGPETFVNLGCHVSLLGEDLHCMNGTQCPDIEFMPPLET
jgi:hypothetical protein